MKSDVQAYHVIRIKDIRLCQKVSIPRVSHACVEKMAIVLIPKVARYRQVRAAYATLLTCMLQHLYVSVKCSISVVLGSVDMMLRETFVQRIRLAASACEMHASHKSYLADYVVTLPSNESRLLGWFRSRPAMQRHSYRAAVFRILRLLK